MEEFCRAIYDEAKNEVSFESSETRGLSLSQTIEDDKRYGTFEPSNGKYFTYRVIDGDVEFSPKQAKRAMQFGMRRWRLYPNLPPFRPAKQGQAADFTLEFQTVQSDPRENLTENTIMYHFYPIKNLQSQNRGVCVVNKKFYYTEDGNPILGSEMIGKEVQFPDGTYRTMDFDQVYAHEIGHGLGLPHDTEYGQVMSSNYKWMAEYPQMRDQARMMAKYGPRIMPGWLLKRWLVWLKWASDRKR